MPFRKYIVIHILFIFMLIFLHKDLWAGDSETPSDASIKITGSKPTTDTLDYFFNAENVKAPSETMQESSPTQSLSAEAPPLPDKSDNISSVPAPKPLASVIIQKKNRGPAYYHSIRYF